MQDVDLNWVAIIVAAIIPIVLGALWYSPLLFADPWMRAVGRTREELGDPSVGYLLSAIGAFLSAYVLARIVKWAEVEDLWYGALVGVFVWAGFVATVLGVTTFFAGRPRSLWLINSGYQLVALVLMGALLGAWD